MGGRGLEGGVQGGAIGGGGLGGLDGWMDGEEAFRGPHPEDIGHEAQTKSP